MSSSRRRSQLPRSFVVFAVLAFALTGCGIKSSLEQPQASLQTEPDAVSTPSAVKETSRVVGGQGYQLLPPQRPPEWEKDNPKRNRSSATKDGTKSTAPEKPFILDGLL